MCIYIALLTLFGSLILFFITCGDVFLTVTTSFDSHCNVVVSTNMHYLRTTNPLGTVVNLNNI